jgi:LmbE family N-acetylglucosaminyl deacetylase
VFTVSNWLGEGLRPRPPEEVTPLRRREEEVSARLLGARTLGLGFWDVDCRTLQRAACEGYPMPDDFRWELDPALRPQEELDRIRASLATIATRLRPQRIYLPLGIGGQSDHRLVAQIASSMRATFAAAAPEVFFYEDQPYASKPGVDVEALVRAAAPDLEPELVDVTDTFERKLQAVAAHRSQLDRAEIEPTLRRYAEGLTGARAVERVWRAPR